MFCVIMYMRWKWGYCQKFDNAGIAVLNEYGFKPVLQFLFKIEGRVVLEEIGRK